MTNHPLFDIAARIAHIFVVGMSIAAFAAVPIVLAIALLEPLNATATAPRGVLKAARCSLRPM